MEIVLSWIKRNSPQVLKCIKRCFPSHTGACLQKINHDGICKVAKITWIIAIVSISHALLSWLSGLSWWEAFVADIILFFSLIKHWVMPDHTEASPLKEAPLSNKQNASLAVLVRQKFQIRKRGKRANRRVRRLPRRMRQLPGADDAA